MELVQEVNVAGLDGSLFVALILLRVLDSVLPFQALRIALLQFRKTRGG